MKLFRRLENWLNNPSSLFTICPNAYFVIYNFSWDKWIFIFENRISRVALLFTGIGYFILLNDYVTSEIGFKNITDGKNSVLTISNDAKLRFLYFGSLLIALGRLIYLWKRPSSIKFGPDLSSWVHYGFTELTYSDLHAMNDQIDTKGHRTLYGKYYTDDWEAFAEEARWQQSGKSEKLSGLEKRKNRQYVNFRAAKECHENLIRSILIDRYFEYAASRKFTLLVAITLSSFGFVLFFIPALDLFLTILAGTLFATSQP